MVRWLRKLHLKWGLKRTKKIYHIKFKGKTGYLGEKINILPWQMAEQLAVEVNVKNVTEHARNMEHTGQAPLFG